MDRVPRTLNVARCERRRHGYGPCSQEAPLLEPSDTLTFTVDRNALILLSLVSTATLHSPHIIRIRYIGLKVVDVLIPRSMNCLVLARHSGFINTIARDEH